MLVISLFVLSINIPIIAFLLLLLETNIFHLFAIMLLSQLFTWGIVDDLCGGFLISVFLLLVPVICAFDGFFCC